MLCPVFTYAGGKDWPAIEQKLAGRANPDAAVESRVRDIITSVAAHGDNAVVDYTRRFDCESFSADMIRVPKADLANAALNHSDVAALEQAAANIRAFHEEQKSRSWITTRPDGAVLGQLVRPVDSVGLYVPGGAGGATPLISSLLMNAIPAQTAGVERIAVATPPRADGSVHPAILAAARMLGLDEIYRMGSAWAIAAFVHGTQTVARTDMVAGPGNIYVTTAKRLLIGTVGVDMIAGPSEVAVLADDSARPDWVAADMLSQAEHDPLAACFCVTTSQETAQAVCAALEEQLAGLPRAEEARQALQNWSGVVVAQDMDAAMDMINRLAPEHLELAVDEPWTLLDQVRHAGAVFMGHYAAEPIGDYFAGPNHVLPTMSTARFASGLSVESFIKRSSLLCTPKSYVQKHAETVARLARMEGLEAHARSVEKRKE